MKDLQILRVFFVLSVLGFGGGKGIFPQMHAQTVDAHHWVTAAQFTQFYALGKLIPGPTTIAAVFIGFAADGSRGAAIAALAMFVPAALLMLGAAMLWRRFHDSPWRERIGAGLAPVVVGLTWASVLAFGKGAVDGAASIVIVIVVAALALRTKLDTPVLIGVAAIAGVAFLR
ncbi:MAG: chromate transporter [Candidatus Eremiobacteraeota bacterium]|nr:chromate transporter [Candidatus Eremiobacteraeota bacterium]